MGTVLPIYNFFKLDHIWSKTLMLSIALSFLFTGFSFGQVTYNGNGNTGFGNPVGTSTLDINHTGGTITGTLTKGTNDLNDIIVIYISNGSSGRSSINFNDNDQSDDLRRAVTNAFGQTINFPAGFEATHAIAIKVNNSALFSFPSSGDIGTGSGNNELNFIDSVGNPTSSTQASFTFSFDWTEIGLTSTDNFGFVITYGDGSGGSGNDAMFSSDEGYGNGISTPNPGFNGWSYTTYFDYPSGDVGGLAESAQTGDWSAATTWVNGNVPLSGDEVEINHDITLDQDATVSSVNITSGNTLTSEASQARTLTVEGGGSFTNNGTFSANDGTVSFSGGATISGTTTFNNVDIAGGVDFGNNSSIGGTLTINGGGFANTNAPIYGSSSTLVFETGSSYTIDNTTTLWTTGSTLGQGIPNNVQVTTTNPLNIFEARDVTGNLTIDSGAAVVQGDNAFIIQNNFVNSGTYSFINNGSSRLTVQGNFNNNNGASFSLSNQIGGDLNLSGNFTDNGSFTANGRAVFFTGTNTQTVDSTTDPLTIDFIIIDKPSNNVQLLQNLDLPNNLEMTSGNLDLNGNTLTISGDIRPNDGSGTIIGDASGSTLIFDDQSTARTLENGDLQNNTIANLTLNESEGVTIDSDLVVTENLDSNAGDNTIEGGHVLDINGATLNVVLGSSFTFKSNSSTDPNNPGTAQLETITNVPGTTITGYVTVERYIPAKRAFRFLASPVTTTDFIFENWQNNGINPTSPDGLGTHISGPSANPATNGLDITSTNNPSMFTFDNTNTGVQGGSAGAWNAVTNTKNTKLESEVPYLLLVRGDRSIDLTNNNATPTETTLSATGSLFAGSSTLDTDNSTASSTGKPAAQELNNIGGRFSLIANPYQAVVDYNKVTKTGLTNFIYVWDPTIGGSNPNGGYVSYELTTGTATVDNAGTSDVDEFLAPGMAFFVQNDGSGNPTLLFEEDDKATGENQVTVFNDSPIFYINSRLYHTSDLQNGNTEKDAVGLRFSSDFSTPGSLEDGSKLINPDENYAVINNGLKSIDKQNLPADGHVIDLYISDYTSTDYSLTYDIENKPENMTIFLADHYLNNQTELTDNFVFDFNVDPNIPESIAYDRFSLVFETSTLNTTENEFGSDFSLYPNPSQNGIFSIKTPNISGKVNVEISNLIGQMLYKQNLSVEAQQVNVEAQNLSTGVYVLKLMQKKQSHTFKVIIE